MTSTDGIRMGVVRGIQYGLVAKPDTFAPQARDLGAGLLRLFFYWSQLEPEPGRYDWSAVDAVLDQVDDDTELWFMICAASPWGSTRSTDLFPGSPPTDPAAYEAMLRALVTHCAGRVRYWQCENEPCIPLFWGGTVTEYLDLLALFHRAVKSADPRADVVLGGCPPGVFPAPETPDEERDFFLRLVAEGAYDVFDIHLYGDPYLIPDTIDDIRTVMRSSGPEKPILAGEYNGPLLFQYPEVMEHLSDVMNSGALTPWHTFTTADFRAGGASAAPAREAMERLYTRMSELPPTLQMFMTGCPPELEAERHRINARDLVVRNLLALSCGVRRTVCWQLGPDADDEPTAHLEMLQLIFSKLMLLESDGETLGARHPSADAFAELAARLDGAESVRRVDVPDAYLFEVTRPGRPSLSVTWVRGAEQDIEWRTAPHGSSSPQ
ncbi:hypothetical protein AB0H88_46250 [Nonomuraea sp. NPDC050680]|uniref:hypothetical protein n=1 Tax=Nonomuraea sp. NPDC050680 TaxID=3154630 RepID=UPI00340BA332